jgi:hypothetical protein
MVTIMFRYGTTVAARGLAETGVFGKTAFHLTLDFDQAQ